MKNPWEEISLADYESHMKLDSVQQLQAMNAIMRGQFAEFPTKMAMVLGVAGGNGLEHVDKGKYRKIYGVDINREYLAECKARHGALGDILECIPADLLAEDTVLPYVELLIANLLVEYIGYECFQRVIRQVSPEFVSCVIQANPTDGFVSDSPYLHVFDGLGQVHHEMDGQTLAAAMYEIGYGFAKTEEYALPNGKKLVRLDFRRKERSNHDSDL